MPTHSDAQDLLSLAEASEISGYHQDYLGALARQGKLNASKVGRNWVVSRPALNEFLGIESQALKEEPELVKSESSAWDEVGEALSHFRTHMEEKKVSQTKLDLTGLLHALRRQLDRSHSLALLETNKLHLIHVAKDYSSYVHPMHGRKFSARRQLFMAVVIAFLAILFSWAVFLAWVFLK